MECFKIMATLQPMKTIHSVSKEESPEQARQRIMAMSTPSRLRAMGLDSNVFVLGSSLVSQRSTDSGKPEQKSPSSTSR